MIINIFGSTGEIGKKTLKILSQDFPNLKVNLLCANSNVNLLIKQIKLYKPRYVYLDDPNASTKLKAKVKKNIQIFKFRDLSEYLTNSKSDFSILAISGYKSLYYLDSIVKNTNNLGIVSKEAIVSAGHLFKKNKYFDKTNIYPLDSEHFSIYEFFNTNKSIHNLNKIYITASGGPFYKKKHKTLDKVKFSQAIKHPKWKMGYKNSIDSATLVNKCLEVVEAHYLFDIEYKKIKVLIHPQAIIHSIIQKDNYVSNLILFKNDMSIPIINFLLQSKSKNKFNNKNLEYSNFSDFNFLEVENDIFPIYKYFYKLDKSKPANLIKFNVGNEWAVNMFKSNLIKYTDIYKIIKKVGSLNLYSSLNTIKEVIEYHEQIEIKIKKLLKNYF